MKIRTILFVIFSFIVNNIFSQELSSIKVIDIYGNHITGQEIIDNNQHLLIYFFTNSCYSCHLVAPHVDTLYMKFGCNCKDVFFIAMNLYSFSTDEQVFNFTQYYGINFPAVSGQGGSSNIAEMFGIGYTPYFILISPNNEIIVNDNYLESNIEELEKILEKY